jgi:hypothetical protein
MVTTAEVIRLFLFPLTGAVAMFVLQPILYQSQLLRLTDVKPQVWVYAHYFPCATIVFAFTIFTALAWCVLNTFSPPRNIKECKKRATLWWGMGAIPILSIALAIFLSRQGVTATFVLSQSNTIKEAANLALKGSNDATISLICLFLVDVLWLYWLTTATSTPGIAAKSLPPGAGLFGR